MRKQQRPRAGGPCGCSAPASSFAARCTKKEPTPHTAPRTSMDSDIRQGCASSSAKVSRSSKLCYSSEQKPGYATRNLHSAHPALFLLRSGVPYHPYSTRRDVVLPPQSAGIVL